MIPAASDDGTILMTSGAILRFLKNEFGINWSVETLRRHIGDPSLPFPAFRLLSSNSAALCARKGAVREWMARCEARGAA